MNIRFAAIIAAAAGLAVAATTGLQPALAQDTEGDRVDRASPAESFSNKELDTYAVALLRVQKISRSYGSRLGDTDDPKEQQAIRIEARQKMVKAVRDTGIALERFNEISRAAQSDDELKEDIEKRVEEAAE